MHVQLPLSILSTGLLISFILKTQPGEHLPVYHEFSNLDFICFHSVQQIKGTVLFTHDFIAIQRPYSILE
jgi:hypothetical protein